MARKHKKISISLIAEEAGVSVPTVSKVINCKPDVSEETRRKVDCLLRKYKFQTSYPKARTSKIAVIYPYTDLFDYYQKVMKGIYAYAGANKLMVNVIIVQSYARESLLEVIRDQQCAGVIALLSEPYRRELEMLNNTELPVVVIDATMEGNNIGFIDNDSYSGSCMAAKHLIDLGHRKIGYITYADRSINQLQRLKGAENTLRSHGIEMPSEKIVRLSLSESTPVRGANGYKAMKQLLSQAPDITAVMAVDDSMALGALAAISDAGLRVPEDISVVGFDNYQETEYWRPALTTVEHPVEKAGWLGIESIHAALNQNGHWTPPMEILPTSLVIRNSTSHPAKE